MLPSEGSLAGLLPSTCLLLLQSSSLSGPSPPQSTIHFTQRMLHTGRSRVRRTPKKPLTYPPSTQIVLNPSSNCGFAQAWPGIRHLRLAINITLVRTYVLKISTCQERMRIRPPRQHCPPREVNAHCYFGKNVAKWRFGSCTSKANRHML